MTEDSKPENKTIEENNKEQTEEKKPLGFASFPQRAVACYAELISLYAFYFIFELLLVKPIYGNTVFSLFLELFTLKNRFLNILFTEFLIIFLLYIVMLIISAFLESSALSAGIGKRVLGIYVTDEHLKPINRKKSLIRNLSKLLSASVLGLGFAFYFFNDKKQALHDVISNTVVLKKSKEDLNILTVIFSVCFILSLIFVYLTGLLIPKEKELEKPKRAVEVIPPAKGFVQEGDKLTKLKESLVVYDPLRESLEIYSSENKFTVEQVSELADKYSETSRDYVDFKIVLKLASGSFKCSNDSILESSYYVSGAAVDVAENKPEVNEIKCEIINDSHFFARFFRKKIENSKDKNWEIQISSKLKIRRESAKLKFDSEKSETLLALWHHSQGENIVEIGFFNERLSPDELLAIRTAKSFVNSKPQVIVTFELQKESKDLNVATVTKYGVSFLRTEENYFPGKQEKIDFYYVPSVTENLQLAKLIGRLAEGERVSGYLNNQAKKMISEVDFDVEWDISFNSPLIDLEKASIDFINNIQVGSEKEEYKETFCKIKADQTELEGVDSVALYYPEEGDVAIGVFGDPLTESEKEEFRKKKSIWSNVNNKYANFVVFFDFKREARSFSREMLLQYNIVFIKDKFGRLYFSGDSDRAQFNFKDVDFTAEDLINLDGSTTSEISFYLKKKKESKLSGIQFSWDCKLKSKILNAQ